MVIFAQLVHIANIYILVNLVTEVRAQALVPNKVHVSFVMQDSIVRNMA